ncbi:coatomer subunit delta-like [Corticium candelabrum]|uniref:coatomer subunit delta-like n=1 Tax=Corticium candelabrum TaxID=121492 RepID=UPI002E254AC0|nr:coatomer subunit delta-like [Corticium candelabrum]
MMVLLAAAICTRAGKPLISRQFVEMSRSRIEGLLAAFPKLVGSGKQVQHTFVETESVRYVYQPLDKMYMVLITTKASNILEDLETLRLFSRVVPEYCSSLEESEVCQNAFELIFAFDEVIALGYRENVNLAQIRTYTEMDSHEEKMFMAVRQTQMEEAKAIMKQRAKELNQIKKDAQRSGKTKGFAGGIGSGDVSSHMIEESRLPISTTSVDLFESSRSSLPSTNKPTLSKALRLGSKSKDVDSFVAQLRSEGTDVTTSLQLHTARGAAPLPTSTVHTERSVRVL